MQLFIRPISINRLNATPIFKRIERQMSPLMKITGFLMNFGCLYYIKKETQLWNQK
nr:MAG TPA: hypothetical protein [Caudoviricetes sp.]